MKRLSLLLTGLLIAGAATVAMAGDYHKSASLVCSDCHVMHYSQQHGYAAGGLFTPMGAGPHEALLRNTPTELCLTCHNGVAWAPDVFGDNNGTAGIRMAGGLNTAPGHGLTNDAGYDVIDGHTLFSSDPPPGGTGTAYVPDANEGLWCGSCHGVHGSVNYRNLGLRGIFAGDTVSYAVGTNDLTKDVFERTATGYTVADVDFNEPNVGESKYGVWCKNCHVEFHGQVGSAEIGAAGAFHRHPVAGVDLGASARMRTTALVNNPKVMDSQGLWTDASTTLTPSCMSCHKGHGNKNAFGLIFMGSNGTVTEDGDGGTFREMCRQCHPMGS